MLGPRPDLDDVEKRKILHPTGTLNVLDVEKYWKILE
jgi:hypothetical protein